MIDGHVLILNRSYVPIHITSIKRAVCLVFKGLARVIDEQYRAYDFQSWSELSVATHDEAIHLTQKAIRVPHVILLQFYDKLPRKRIRFSRENIYLRDHNTCQYCDKKFKRSDLNIDHVVPLSRGGGTSWENVVCSCIACNAKKGGRLPHENSMRLMRQPVEPRYSIFMHITPQKKLFETWHIYMNPVDFAYWNLDLTSDS